MSDSSQPEAQQPPNAPRRRSRRRGPLVAVIGIGVVVAAYFGVMAAVRAHVDGLIENAVDRPVPEFRLADRTGKEWTHADLQGRRAVLHFFRSRCGSCEIEAPEIRALEAALPADVVLLHVMTDVVMEFDDELTTATIERKNYARPILMADAKFMDEFHKVAWSQVTPVTYVVDAQGVVRFGLRGKQTQAAIEAALAAAG